MGEEGDKVKTLMVVHCDVCGREIINVDPSFVVSERENYVIVECVCCSHHQSIPYKNDEGRSDHGGKSQE